MPDDAKPEPVSLFTTSGAAAGRARTPAQDREYNALLRDFDRAVVGLWKLGCDPVGRVRAVTDGARLDGVERGCSLIATMKEALNG